MTTYTYSGTVAHPPYLCKFINHPKVLDILVKQGLVEDRNRPISYPELFDIYYTPSLEEDPRQTISFVYNSRGFLVDIRKEDITLPPSPPTAHQPPRVPPYSPPSPTI